MPDERRGLERDDDVHEPGREEEADAPCGHTEQEALRQPQAHKARSAGAQSQPHRHFHLTRGRTRHQKVRDIRAREREHEHSDHHRTKAGENHV